jgi:hypothetical protein
MSDRMFERAAVLLHEDFNRGVARMNELERKELELEYESLTGMECDDTAKLQTNEQFKETMRQAYEIWVQKKKRMQVVEIYA